jgi:hypothetical protein
MIHEKIDKLKELPNLVFKIKPGKRCFFLRICPLSDECIAAVKSSNVNGYKCDIKEIKEMYKIESNPF